MTDTRHLSEALADRNRLEHELGTGCLATAHGRMTSSEASRCGVGNAP